MTPMAAIEEVKKEIEGIFGRGLMGAIIISARHKSNAPIIGMNGEHYTGMVEQICSDARVMEMFGAAGTRQKLSRWLKLVN